MAKARKKNPKRKMPPALKRYWAARNRRIKNPRKRRRNPIATQHVLLAQRPGGPVLKYLGGIKFAQTGHGVRFGSRLEALRAARQLRGSFPILKKYKVWAT
jgi:hypothetical protein